MFEEEYIKVMKEVNEEIKELDEQQKTNLEILKHFWDKYDDDDTHSMAAFRIGYDIGRMAQAERCEECVENVEDVKKELKEKRKEDDLSYVA